MIPFLVAGEMLHVAQPFFQKYNLHPTVVVAAYRKALDDCLTRLDELAVPIDIKDREKMLSIVKSTLGMFCLCV